MKRLSISFILISLAVLLSPALIAQNWAGEDQSLCGSSEGTYIGLENAPSEYCYTWSPTTGMEGDPHQARVIVKPEETTTYSVTVTGANFSFMQVDEVVVDVDFGAVEFTPGFANPDGSSGQSTAVVTNNPGNEDHTWSILEPAGPERLGCSIDPNTGVISGCNMSGEITVQAQRTDFPVCKAEKKFRVNTGVRDVEARDISTDNGNRVAKTGETLILVGRNGVNFKAIPNENEQFGFDDFDWTGPGVPTTGIPSWNSTLGTPTELTVSANDKTVHVERRQTTEFALSNPLGNLVPLLQSGLLKFKPVREYSGLDDIGSCFPPFDPDDSPEFALNYKRETTNKYNSPEEGYKYTIEGVVSLGATGRMCFPPPYSSAPNPFGFYYTYAFLSGTVKLVASGSKDEGAMDQTWNWNTLVAEGEIKAGLGADFGASLPGNIITVNGSIKGSTAIVLTAQWNKPHVEGKIKFEPLIVEGEFAVWVTNPNDPIIGPVSGKYNVVDPFESSFTPIFTFE